MTLPAPYPPLVSGGDGLDRYPGDASALAARMAALYAVPADQVLPVRGLTHGLELAWRLAARDGGSVEAPKAEPYDSLAAIYPSKGEAASVKSIVVIRELGSPEAVAEMAARVAPALLVVDEGLIEFSDSIIGRHSRQPTNRTWSSCAACPWPMVWPARGSAPRSRQAPDAGPPVLRPRTLRPARAAGAAGACRRWTRRG